MWEFFDRLIALAIPRIRDFRGLNPKGFDGRGNYSFGVTDNITVTPAIFGIDEGGTTEDMFGGIVKTTFTF